MVDRKNSIKMEPPEDQIKSPKKYFCDICEKSFCQIPSLEMHVIIKHLRVKVFKCDMCENSFYHYSALKDHIKLYHQQAEMSQLYAITLTEGEVRAFTKVASKISTKKRCKLF